MHLPDLASVNYTLAILGIISVGVGWWRGWLESPKRRQEREQRELERAQQQAVAEAILGEPESRDLAGKILKPAVPGLVSRTSTLEQAVSTLINQDARIEHLEKDHGSRIKALEDIRVEKLLGQAESVHMWRAVADRDVLDAED